MTGRRQQLEVEPGETHRPGGQRQHPGGQVATCSRAGRSGRAKQIGDHRMHFLGQAGEWIDQLTLIIRPDPTSGVVAVGDLRSRGRVIEVAVGEQHRHRPQIVFGDDVTDPVSGIHSRVDDHAIGVRSRSDQVTIGCQWTGRERSKEHITDSIGQDEAMSDDARAGMTPEAPPEDQAPTEAAVRPDEQPAPAEIRPESPAPARPEASEPDQEVLQTPAASPPMTAAPPMTPPTTATPPRPTGLTGVPRPGPPHPRPTAVRPAAVATAPPAAPADSAAGDNQDQGEPVETTDSDAPPAATFGRVGDDGTVYLQTANGERSVGQVPDATPDEALEFFVKRYDALRLEVSLLERRIRSGALSPDDAGSSIKTVRSAVAEAHAVGDLDGLLTRLDALSPLVARQRARRRADRAKQSEATRSAKENFVAEAERLAQSNDWRGGVNRFRSLLDEWKLLPRLDRATDDALWHRFSSARTQYTRRRKAQFAQQAEQRDSAQKTKHTIIADAEALVGSTDWGTTTGEFRELMTRWKAAGPAPRDVDEELWRRFREIQDTFFAAKQAAMSEQDNEFRENQQAKEALLVEGEKLLPVRDLEAGRAGYRDLIDRWSAIGKVPRDAMRPLEARLHAVEAAVRGAEEDRWRRTNPEARARAEETAAKLQAQIASYEERATKAAARGDGKAEQEAKDGAATYREWLTQAERAVDDFSGN